MTAREPRTSLSLGMEDVTALLGAVRSELSEASERLGEHVVHVEDPESMEMLAYMTERADRLDRLEKRVNAAGLRLQRVLSR